MNLVRSNNKLLRAGGKLMRFGGASGWVEVASYTGAEYAALYFADDGGTYYSRINDPTFSCEVGSKFRVTVGENQYELTLEDRDGYIMSNSIDGLDGRFINIFVSLGYEGDDGTKYPTTFTVQNYTKNKLPETTTCKIETFVE